MWIEQEKEKVPGPAVRISCPACHKDDVSAKTYDEHIQERLNNAISVNQVCLTWIVCSECGAKLRSRVPAAQLGGKSAKFLAQQMYFDDGFLAKALAIIALLVAIFPIVGTVVALLAWQTNRKTPSWPKKVSLAAIVLSLAPVAVFGCAIVSDVMRNMKR